MASTSTAKVRPYAEKYPLTFLKAPVNQQLLERYQRAWQVARAAADLLKKEYQAERVVVFGSLTHQDRFTPWSDIDLAAWGIPDERYYAAVAAVTGLSTEFKVDLLDFTSCYSPIQKAVESEGIDL